MDKQKEQLVEALKEYGLIVCHPEERCIAELQAVLSVFIEDDPVSATI